MTKFTVVAILSVCGLLCLLAGHIDALASVESAKHALTTRTEIIDRAAGY